MTYIAKKCIGCQSNRRRYGTTYMNCKLNLGKYNKDYKLFREHYCPCVECLVKATCTELKISYATEEGHDKCKLLKDQINKFKRSR